MLCTLAPEYYFILISLLIFNSVKEVMVVQIQSIDILTQGMQVRATPNSFSIIRINSRNFSILSD